MLLSSTATISSFTARVKRDYVWERIHDICFKNRDKARILRSLLRDIFHWKYTLTHTHIYIYVCAPDSVVYWKTYMRSVQVARHAKQVQVHHMYFRENMSDHQFGFRPQTSTIDAALAIKTFVQESLDAGEVIAMVSLDVQGAFDAAW